MSGKIREIFIRGARSNNLKNVSILLPHDRFIVVTGVSGSGKSSLTIDTLFAEGQRRYVESLSSYARQFLMRMKKPEVDSISGLCPAIAIEQKVSTANARSTVGTLTELHDYMRLLFARIGRTISPISGEPVKKHSVADVLDYLSGCPAQTRASVYAPIRSRGGRSLRAELEYLVQRGFNRVRLQGVQLRLDGESGLPPEVDTAEEALLLVDRFVLETDDADNQKRIADSVQTAFAEGHGDCLVEVEGMDARPFNNRFELDGMLFEEPTPQLFNYNNPFGACPTCEGYGKVMGIDEDKVIPDKSLSVLEDCVACWRGEVVGAWKKQFVEAAHRSDFPVYRAYRDLTREERRTLWKGNAHCFGIDVFFKELESATYKIQNRVMLARYRGRTVCPDCDGDRLRAAAIYVKVGSKSIAQLMDLPVLDLIVFFEELQLSDYERTLANRMLVEINGRLGFMREVGLGYLTLGRLSATLSGGETQRINLTRTLGSNLTSSLYILDEPSIGLHPRDTARLVGVLKALRDLGNTVVVVEHEEEMIAQADYLVDMGPEAGIHGGEVVFAGPYDRIHDDASGSLTAGYMSGRMAIPVPERRRTSARAIALKGCRQHNLKDVDATFPLQALTVVTGVSGSGKTTLIKQILYPALKKHFNDPVKEAPGAHDALVGDLSFLGGVELVNQSPIGKSSRSNPVTYVKAYDAIRDLFTKQQLAKLRGFKPKHFSFNVEGGRCETCSGEGETVVSMQFLADVRLVCEECNGMRFRPEVLDVTYKGKNIFEVLDMSVEESLGFFADEKEVVAKLRPLLDVGLGYVKLGQSSSTLSGGEAQRVKLASFLGRESNAERLFFIFDEPTTGLHFHDVRKLLAALNALVEKGHTVVVVEHNLDVVKCADWILDLGPEGGHEGGHLVFQGTPEELAASGVGHTSGFLKEKL
jgi:excinuclease ABC subunit A